MVLELIVNYAIFIVLLISVFFSLINMVTAGFATKNEKEYGAFYPKVSAVVRVWNDDLIVERCIKNLLEQDYPKNRLEIIIADDSTDDRTKKVCSRFKGKIKYIKMPHSDSKAEVLDSVIKNAKGDVIVEKDVDGIARKDWISEIVKPLQKKNIAGVTGPVFAGNAYKYASRIAHMRSIENFWQFGGGAAGRYNITKEAIMYGGNMAYKKSAWKEVGGHPKKTLVEDAELSMMFLKKGYKIAFAKKAQMLQEEVENLEQYVNERKRWTTGNFAVWNKYSDVIKQDKLDYLLLMSNFSMDAWFFFSWVLMPFQPLFVIPLLLNLSALWITIAEYRGNTGSYACALLYTILNPILQTIAIMSIIKERDIEKKKIKWVKIKHYPVKLKWPIKL